MKKKILAGIRTLIVCACLIGSIIIPVFCADSTLSKIGLFVVEWGIVVILYIVVQILIGFVKGLYSSFLNKEDV